MIPFLLAAILFSYFGLQRRGGSRAGRTNERDESREIADDARDHRPQGMNYLESSLPRRVVTVYIPLAVFLFVLLFPFYWMAITSFKPNAELLSREGNPFWVIDPTLGALREAAVPHRRIRAGCGTRC